MFLQRKEPLHRPIAICERLVAYSGSDMLHYALFANSLSYLQYARKDDRLELPSEMRTVEDLIALFKERGIFAELLEREEVYNTVVTRFTYEDDIRADAYKKGNERGIEKGIRALIYSLNTLDVPEEAMVQLLVKQSDMSEYQAKDCLEKYR
jgi:hypothetical protein